MVMKDGREPAHCCVLVRRNPAPKVPEASLLSPRLSLIDLSINISKISDEKHTLPKSRPFSFYRFRIFASCLSERIFLVFSVLNTVGTESLAMLEALNLH